MSTVASFVPLRLLCCFVPYILVACGGTAPSLSVAQPTIAPSALSNIQEASASAVTVPTNAPSAPTLTELPTQLPILKATTPSASQQDVITKVDAFLSKYVKQGHFSGSVLIAKGSTVLLARGYGLADVEKQLPNTPQTRFRLASITKQFTAMAILMLQEQGKLSVDDPVCNYIPDCPESWQAIKIHHLLTHTAGLFDFRDFASNEQTTTTPSTSAQVIARIKAKPLGFAPGTSWSYSNGNFMVAGYVVEQVSGQPYEQFLQEHIFGPLDMKNTGYAHDDKGLAIGYSDGSKRAIRLDGSLPFAAAGLFSTVEDLYVYSQALNSKQLLSQKSLDAFFGLHKQVDADGGFSPGYQLPVYYGYGWAIANYNKHRLIGHDGMIEGYSGDLRRFPDDNWTIILLMNRTEPYAPVVSDEIVRMLFE